MRQNIVIGVGYRRMGGLFNITDMSQTTILRLCGAANGVPKWDLRRYNASSKSIDFWTGLDGVARSTSVRLSVSRILNDVPIFISKHGTSNTKQELRERERAREGPARSCFFSAPRSKAGRFAASLALILHLCAKGVCLLSVYSVESHSITLFKLLS